MLNTTINNNGILKSNVLFYYLRVIYNCLTYLKHPKIVGEIGPGYAELIRLWAINPIYNPKNFVLIDIPESLFFADIYLSSLFGSEQVYYVSNKNINNWEEIFKKYRFILCPINHLEKISSLHIDLIINTGSMQEMTEEWVDFWMKWLDKQKVTFLYSLNYFAQDISYMAEGANSWAPRLSKNWIHKIQRFNPFWVRLQTARNYGEILAEKVTAITPISHSELKYGYRILEERYMDGDLFMELLDLYRRSKNIEFGFKLLQKTFNTMMTIPKELYYLSISLNKNKASLSVNNQKELIKIIEKIKEIRKNGIESIIHPE